MRPLLSLLSATTLALALLVQPAQAAADPVKALNKQFAEGNGLRIARSIIIKSPKRVDRGRQTGQILLGKDGVAASDLTTTNAVGSMRTIDVDGATYLSGWPVDGFLPRGKTWAMLEGAGLGFDEVLTVWSVDILKPGALQTLLSGTSKRAGTYFEGSVAVDKLVPYSRWWALGFGTGRLTWRLWVRGDGLPVRLQTTYKLDKNIYTYNTLYRAWGEATFIVAPTQVEVIPLQEALEQYFAEHPELLPPQTS